MTEALPVGLLRGACLAALAVLVSYTVSAQDALKTSLAGDAAIEARRVQEENLPYTFKTGDLRLLATTSLGLDWNDNVFLTHENRQDDFILRPRAGVDASYPLTERNLLQLNVTFGYDEYFNHHDLSAWYLQSGSALSFDIYVKDFWINLHDRFSYLQDPAGQAALANTGNYGTFLNTAGLLGTWDLQDVTLSLGYDHLNYLSTATQYEYTDHASEMLVTRAGLQVHPRVTVGVEGTASYTTYNQQVLNDNTAYSAGLYGDWRPGPYFRLQPRIGYTFYDFRQTSLVAPAQDQDTWYADLTVSHNITETISYGLSAGHELRLGIESDTIEDWYVRPGMTWKLLKNVTLQTSLFYEHGQETGGRVGAFAEENYDWYGGNIGLNYAFVKNLTASLNYRLTLRASNDTSREYNQNMVGLQLSYTPK